MPFISRRVSAFSAAADGAVAVTFALLTMVFFTFIGVAVDYSRWSNLREKASNALDSALLAGGRAMQTGASHSEAIALAKKHFEVLVKGKLDIINPQVTITLTADGQGLEGVSWGKMRTPFLGLVKTKSLKVAAGSAVGFSVGAGSAKGGSDIEISLMLDVTGSMCDDANGPCANSAKLDALKSSAADLVNIILKNSQGQSARIALVPFATRVRVGTFETQAAGDLMTKLTNLPDKWSGWYQECPNGVWTPGATSENDGTWDCGVPVNMQVSDWAIMPCVTDRTGAEKLTDAKPQSNAWLNANDGGRRVLSWDSSDTNTVANDGTTAAKASDQWNYSEWDCSDIDAANVVVPLTHDKTALLAAVNNLVATGSTAGALGTAWSWYTLSPEWTQIFNGNSAPGSYADTVAAGTNPPKLRKIAVLMTDGVYNTYRGWKDHDADVVSGNAKTLCTNMKAKGIEVFTVGFDLASLPSADHDRAVDVLQSCGTDLQHFYDALNAEQLKQSFRDIALQLSQLFVAK